MHQRGLTAPHDEFAREWYLRVLDLEHSILRNMGSDQEELRVVDLIEQVYQPLPSWHIWPLMRLGRFDESREWLEKSQMAGSMRVRVLNSRMALEEEAGRRHESYEAGKAAVTAESGDSLLWRNFAEICSRDHRFGEAIDAILKANLCWSADDYEGSPFTEAAWTHGLRNSLPAAWACLKRAQETRRARAPYTLAMDQDSFDRATAHVLFLLGRGDDAYQWAKRSLERPGRKHFSGEARDFAFNNRFFLWLMIRHRQRELAELQAFGAEPTTSAALLDRRLDLERWTLEREMIKLIQDPKFLHELFTPLAPGNAYLYDVATPNTLFLPDLGNLVPRGIAWEAIGRARRAESHPAAGPYFDSMEAELEWNAGRTERTLELCSRAREKLSPDFDRCLRARLAVMAGSCLVKLGRGDEAIALYNEALANCPVVFRMLAVAVPIAIVDDGTPLAGRWAQRLAASRSFRADPSGFTMKLSSAENKLAFEFFRLQSVLHCTGSVPLPSGEGDLLAGACTTVMARMLSPSLELTTLEINLLDNSLYAAPRKSQTDRLLHEVSSN